MSKEKFKDTWREYSKLDKLGFITYLILPIGYIILLIYYGVIDEKIIEMFRLTYEGKETTFFNMLALISMAIGLMTISNIFFNIVETIFYPETKNERIIKDKKRELKRKNPLKLALMKLNKIKSELKIKELDEKIKEWNEDE